MKKLHSRGNLYGDPIEQEFSPPTIETGIKKGKNPLHALRLDEETYRFQAAAVQRHKAEFQRREDERER